MPFHLIQAGPVRSREEMTEYMVTVRCTSCEHEGLIPFSNDALHDGDGVAVSHGKCAICGAYTDVIFSAAPGWGTEPTDDLHLAVGDHPSVLLPESYFRANAARAAASLRRSD